MNKEILQNLINDNLSIVDISTHLKISKGSVQYWLVKHGLKTKNKTPSKYIPYENRLNAECNSCKEIKALSEFYIYTYKNGVKRPSFYCKTCSKFKSTNPRDDRKLWAVEYKGGKCFTCGYSNCVKALEFHHKDPSIKEGTPSTLLGKNLSRDILKKELDKCVLLCANCHREFHAGILDIPENSC